MTHDRGTETKAVEFDAGVRPPLPRSEYDHVHVGGECVHNRWPECREGQEPPPPETIATTSQLIEQMVERHDERVAALAPVKRLCNSCALAKMLEKGVFSDSIDAGHSSCEGTADEPCACKCEYAQMHQCRECGRKGTTLDDHGQCVDRTNCANAILEASTQRAAARAAAKAETPAKRSPSGGSATKRPCKCGCGEMTGGGMYRPGHDARHVSALTRAVKAGETALHDAVGELAHSAKLQDKLRKAVGIE